jgi:crossover junction endodeoxyribonuclease RuvC
MNTAKCPIEVSGEGIFCGIDASLTGTGLCRLENGIINYETIKTTPFDEKKPGKANSFAVDLERYLFIAEKVMEFVPDNARMVCIEDFYTPRNAAQMGSAIALVGLGTYIRIRLHQRKIPFCVVAPLTLKKYATGKGSGTKDVIMMHLFKRYGLEFGDNNQADAFALSAIAHSIHEKIVKGKSEVLTKPQQEAIKKIMDDSKKYNMPS